MFDGNGSEQIYSLITTPYDFVQPAHANTSKSVTLVTLNGTPAVRALNNLRAVPPRTNVYTQMFSENITSTWHELSETIAWVTVLPRGMWHYTTARLSQQGYSVVTEHPPLVHGTNH
jgi:hypothetical protein